MSDVGVAEVRALIEDWIENVLSDYVPEELLTPSQATSLIAKVADALARDLHKCKHDDRAADDKSEAYVFRTSLPLAAIGKYRIAHGLIELSRDLPEMRREVLEIVARKLTESGATTANVDIHPEAEIGVPFRIDHGRGIVIGQQVRIGDNCALLNHVVLGATGMDPKAVGPGPARRHPTLGNDVEIYEDASVLGDVTVHDGAEIGTGCKIRFDVPPGTTVRLISQLEMSKGDNCPEVHGVRWPGRNLLEIWGSGLKAAIPTLIDDRHEALEGVECQVAERDDDHLAIEVTVNPRGIEIPSPPRLKLCTLDDTVVVVHAVALRLLWRNCDEISREPAASGAAGA